MCNLATMVGTSDIRDWCFVEAMGAKGLAAYTETPSAADLEVFLAASPISHASKVRCATHPLLAAYGGLHHFGPTSKSLGPCSNCLPPEKGCGLWDVSSRIQVPRASAAYPCMTR